MSDKLIGVDVYLAGRVGQILVAMRALGFPMLVTNGLRTLEEQRALYALGRTKPGKVVTNADGVTFVSMHQAGRDGYGRAVDCCFVVDGAPSWGERNPWNLYGEMARALGLRWGGDFRHFVDRTHVELPPIIGLSDARR